MGNTLPQIQIQEYVVWALVLGVFGEAANRRELTLARIQLAIYMCMLSHVNHSNKLLQINGIPAGFAVRCLLLNWESNQ